MKQDNRQTQLILCLFGILPVAWLGLLIAPAVSGGLPEIITAFPAAMNDPFHIVLCEDSLKTVLIALCAYGMGIGIYFSTRRNYRKGEEHGSAKWGDARAVDKKYRDKRPEQNKLFTQNVRMGLDGRKAPAKSQHGSHRRQWCGQELQPCQTQSDAGQHLIRGA